MKRLARLFLFTSLVSVGAASAAPTSEGLQLYNQHKFEPAIQAFANNVQQDPRDTVSCYYLASSCYALRRFDEAIKLYWYIARNFPSSREAYSSRAFLKQIDHDYNAHSNDPSLLTFPKIEGVEMASTKSAPVNRRNYSLSASDKQTIINSIVMVVRAQANRPEVSAGMISGVKEALNAYPNNLLALVAVRGCKIYLTPTVIDKEPELQNTRPSGYEDGQTYKNCPGFFDGKEIILCELALSPRDDSEWTTIPDPVGTLRHELGHAVDRYLGLISNTEEFKHTYLLEVAKVDDSDKPAISYYLQKDIRGPRETFAELMCALYGGRQNNNHTEKLAQNFPELSKLISKKIAAIPSL